MYSHQKELVVDPKAYALCHCATHLYVPTGVTVSHIEHSKRYPSRTPYMNSGE